MHITSNTSLVHGCPAGTVVSIDCGIYRHVGMLSSHTSDGQRLVLAFSAKAGGFTEQTIEDFADGKSLRVERYLGKLSPGEVLARAQHWRGLSYSLLERNCEHFVYYAHGLSPQSPQLVMAGFSVILWLFLRPAQMA